MAGRRQGGGEGPPTQEHFFEEEGDPPPPSPPGAFFPGGGGALPQDSFKGERGESPSFPRAFSIIDYTLGPLDRDLSIFGLYLRLPPAPYKALKGLIRPLSALEGPSSVRIGLFKQTNQKDQGAQGL